MQPGARSPRGLVTTALISFFLTAFAGYLWIGRGKRAAWFFFAFVAIKIAFLLAIVSGVASFPHSKIVGPIGYELMLTALIGLASLALVLPVRTSSTPDRWYSKGGWVALLTVLALLAYACIAILFRGLIAQTFSTPASSMMPTLLEGDLFVANKRAYGYNDNSFPFPVGLGETRIWAATPSRGDVVVFKYPVDRQYDYVKRVIGLPGEHVQVIDGIVHINGVALKREQTKLKIEGFEPEGAVYREMLPEGGSYLTIDLRSDAPLDNTPDYLVPENSYFVMGDHRDNSADSRVFGFVDASLLVGRAERIYWNSEGLSIEGRSDLRMAR